MILKILKFYQNLISKGDIVCSTCLSCTYRDSSSKQNIDLNNHYFNNEEEDTFFENSSFLNEQTDKPETELINGNINAMQNFIQNDITSDVSSNDGDPKDTVSINICRTKINYKKCIICNDAKKKLNRVNRYAMVDALVRKNILIPEGSTSCTLHFEDHNSKLRLNSSALVHLEVFDNRSKLKIDEIENIIEMLRYETLYSNIKDRCSDFHRIDSAEIKDLTGKINNYQQIIFV